MGNTAAKGKSEQQHQWLIWKKPLDLLKQNFLKVAVTEANLRKPPAHPNFRRMVERAKGRLSG